MSSDLPSDPYSKAYLAAVLFLVSPYIPSFLPVFGYLLNASNLIQPHQISPASNKVM